MKKLGKLNTRQINHLLKNQAWGRLGCHCDGVTYVVPVNYVYDGGSIYCHSGEGMKVKMMRKNPEVCFEVEAIDNIVNWQSVIAWGRFEELTDMCQKQEVMQKLIDSIMPLTTGNTAHPSHGITAAASDIGTKIDLVLYKIVLKEKTGRFEKR